MTGVAAFLGLVVAFSALLCGHHAEDVVRALCRRPQRPSWARGRISARRLARRIRREAT